MKAVRAAAALFVLLVLSSCGQQSAETVTTTVTTKASAAAVRTAAKPRPSKKPKASKRAKPAATWVQCDANIEAKRPHTSCGFAQNAFYEYWAAPEAASLRVYSPAVARSFTTRCSSDGYRVTCRTGDGGRARFSITALDAYSAKQAGNYAASHDTGTDSTSALAAAEAAVDADLDSYGAADDEPYDGSADVDDDYEDYPSVDDPPDYDAPSAGDEIPNYDNGTGYRVQCADGMYSQSGGRQGACSGHGGVG